MAKIKVWSFGNSYGEMNEENESIVLPWHNIVDYITNHGNYIDRLRALGGSSSSGNGYECDEKMSVVLVMYIPLIALVVASVILWAQKKFLPRVPVSCKVFVFGLLLGVINRYSGKKIGSLSDSIEYWVDINPELIMAIFIPMLIFSDSIKTDIHMLRRCFFQCIVISFSQVFTMIALLGVTAKYLFSSYHWSWETCFLFGAVVAANDPPSISATLENIPLTPKMVIILNGEANFSAPLALVIFSILLAIRVGEKFTSLQVAALVANEVIVGVLIGFALGIGFYYLVMVNGDRTSRRSILVQISLLTSLGFMSYLVSERNVSSNGVLSSFSASIMIAATCWPVFSSRTTMRNFWQFVTFAGNSVIFVLSGLIISTEKNNKDGANIEFAGNDYGAVIGIFLLMVAARFAINLVLYPLISRLGYGISKSETFAISFTGIRGAINLTSAIVVDRVIRPTHPEEASQILFVSGGVVLLSLLFNATLLSYVAKFFSLTSRPEVKAKLLAYVLSNFNKKARDAYVECSPKYELHDLNTVVNYISSLTSDMDEEKEINELNPSPRAARAMGSITQKAKRLGRMSLKKQGDISFLSSTNANASLQTNDQNGQVSNSAAPGEKPQVTFKRRKTLKDILKGKSGRGITIDYNLLYAARELFLNALRAAYWQQIVDGVVPKGSSVGRKLLHSVEFALDRVDAKEGLLDFHRLHLPVTDEEIRKTKYAYWAESCGKYLPGWIVDAVGAQAQSEILQEWVFLASCMIEAHEQAQMLYSDLLGDNDRHLPEVDRVLSESEHEVSNARRFLAQVTAIDPEVVELVQNKKIVSIILQKQKKFVDTLMQQGILDEEIHHEFLLNIRADVKSLQHMKLSANRHAAREMFSNIRREISRQRRESVSSASSAGSGESGVSQKNSGNQKQKKVGMKNSGHRSSTEKVHFSIRKNLSDMAAPINQKSSFAENPIGASLLNQSNGINKGGELGIKSKPSLM